MMEKKQVAANNKTDLPFAFVVSITSLAFIVSQLDVSIVNIALPQISESLRAEMSQLQWIVDAYTIAFAVLMLSAGNMSDLLGSKRLFQVGILVFGVASLGCAISWSPTVLICFRVLQGVGSAAMIPSSLSILNQTYAHDPKKRAKAITLWTTAGSTSIAAGPIIGGLLLHVSDWRMIFYVNIPICLAGIIASVRLGESERRPSKGFDIPGQIFWMLALTSLIAVIIELPDFGINSPFIIGGLVFSAIMLFIFLLIERKAPSPILPFSLFKSANFNILILVGICLNGAYYGSVFILSIYLQEVLHYSTLVAGLAFIPLTIGLAIANVISGRLMARFGTRVPVLAGLVVFTVGFITLLVAKTDTPYWQLFFPFLCIPMGMGLAVPAMTTGILASIPKNQSGTASAVLNTTRQAAGAIGVAVFGAMASGGAASVVHAINIASCLAATVVAIVALLAYKYLKPV